MVPHHIRRDAQGFADAGLCRDETIVCLAQRYRFDADTILRAVDGAFARLRRRGARYAAEDARTLRIPPSRVVADRRNEWEHTHRVPGRIPALW